MSFRSTTGRRTGPKPTISSRNCGRSDAASGIATARALVRSVSRPQSWKRWPVPSTNVGCRIAVHPVGVSAASATRGRRCIPTSSTGTTSPKTGGSWTGMPCGNCPPISPPEGSRSSARRQAEGGRCRKSVLARLIVPDRALLLPQFFPDGGDDVLDVAGILFGAGQIAQLAGLNDHADILAAGYREPELLRVHRFLAVRQGEIRRIFAERYGHDVLIMKFLGMLVEVGIAQKVEVGLVGAQV